MMVQLIWQLRLLMRQLLVLNFVIVLSMLLESKRKVTSSTGTETYLYVSSFQPTITKQSLHGSTANACRRRRRNGQQVHSREEYAITIAQMRHTWSSLLNRHCDSSTLLESVSAAMFTSTSTLSSMVKQQYTVPYEYSNSYSCHYAYSPIFCSCGSKGQGSVSIRTRTRTSTSTSAVSSSWLRFRWGLSMSSSSSFDDIINSDDEGRSDNGIFNRTNTYISLSQSQSVQYQSDSKTNKINKNNNYNVKNNESILAVNSYTDERGEESLTTSTSQSTTTSEQLTIYEQLFNGFIVSLAQLSLQDYRWRLDLFRSNQAERQLEESLARMRGENATYVRPMDAPVIGPLGEWERKSVRWLLDVFEEEERRATAIIQRNGRLIRPMSIASSSSTSFQDNNDGTMSLYDNFNSSIYMYNQIAAQQQLGPLGQIESRVVQFWKLVKQSELYRYQTKIARPKDAPEQYRGPLGELEKNVVQFWSSIKESEFLRLRLQQQRKGYEIVRPIDVPGPLGELELKVGEIFNAEQKRVKEAVVRPKDAKYRGPMGDAEMKAVDTIQQLSYEEMERLRNMQKVISELPRPMITNKDSVAGVLETIVVGVLRAPILIWSVITRVKSLLLDSFTLQPSDRQIIENQLLRQKDEDEQNQQKQTKW